MISTCLNVSYDMEVTKLDDSDDLNNAITELENVLDRLNFSLRTTMTRICGP